LASGAYGTPQAPYIRSFASFLSPLRQFLLEHDDFLQGVRIRSGKGERHLGKAQLEQPASGLTAIIALRRGPSQDLDLSIIQAEPPVDRCNLRFQRGRNRASFMIAAIPA
jgi:hypothetical protein